MGQWKPIQLVSMRMCVLSLASLSRLRSGCCHELWCRLAAVSLIGRLTCEPPYAKAATLKRLKKKKKKSGVKHCYVFFFLLLFPFFAHVAYGDSQARGRIGATAAGRHHSNTRFEPSL